MTFTVAVDQSLADDGSIKQVQWSGGAGGDTGAQFELKQWDDVTVQVSGTFGTSTVTIKGSNDGTNWHTLNCKHVSSGSNHTLSYTAAGLDEMLDSPRYIRPEVSAGTGTGIQVTAICRRANTMRT